jgi:uncharacterized membrane protein
MSVTQKFLDQLRTNLRRYPSGQVDDYIDYYAELIAERVANGESEAKVLQQIGSPKDVAASFKRDNAIDRVINKPTASNGLKALIAILGVLSLPFLIPVLAIVIAMLFAGLALFAAGLVTLIAGAVAAVFSIIEVTSVVLAGDAPVYLFFLVTGAALVVIFLVFELMRGLFRLGGLVIRSFAHKLKTRQDRKKQLKQDLSEEQ